MTGNQKTDCDQCQFKGNKDNEFVAHLLKEQRNSPELLECRHCEYKAINVLGINEHI